MVCGEVLCDWWYVVRVLCDRWYVVKFYVMGVWGKIFMWWVVFGESFL